MHWPSGSGIGACEAKFIFNFKLKKERMGGCMSEERK